MAVKKEPVAPAPVVSDKKKALETAMQQIEKMYGKGSIMRYGAESTLNVESIPTGSLSLDLALGIGGLPRGRIVEIYGPESSGKTTLALHVLAEAQKMGGEVAFVDAEHALDPTYAKALGVNVEDMLISQPDTGEQALEITEALVRSGAIDVVVVDSVAALVPRAEIEGEMGDSYVGLHARLMSQALRKLTGAVGKTNTIVNTLTTAFFNERTVLFSSYNNHPIDGVVEKLQAVTYHGQTVPFPILRLGNNEKTAEALRTIDQLFEQCKKIPVPERLLDKNHADRTARAKQLTALLERYERILDLRERRETIRRLLDARGQMNFQYELQAGQLPQVNRELAAYGSIDSADALALLDRNEDELLRYLYYTSARCIRRLEEPKYNDLMSIVHSPDTDKERVTQFNKYLSEPENLKKLLRVFPIVATTCISAHRLGDPEPSFDMVIMDEASQCSTAMSLVPILRGASLMLVGDPQQLSPVILLDPADNRTLRRRYGVTQEYDYIENSIYKCFLACDAVSDETLLSYHYRCSPKIIEFNNRKYYNHKLHIASRETDPTPLVYVDVPNDTTDEKNTAPQEVRRIEAYLTAHPDKQVGIITPFAKQRAAIEAMLRAKHFENAACGTVHAFQGDEKDVVIFSLALTDQTRPRTYDWLKTNKELINVATSRAREQLVILSNQAALDRLHADSTDDDIYELVQYVRKNGQSEVTEKPAASRALGIKPYSTKTEDAFLENLNHALDNAFLDGSRCTVRKEVPIAQVFEDNPGCADLFYTGRFDFVVYQREGRRLMPILAIELDGREHRDDPAVRRRDRKKDQICREHGFELIRVENSYARRYNYIKSILINYFRKVS